MAAHSWPCRGDAEGWSFASSHHLLAAISAGKEQAQWQHALSLLVVMQNLVC